MSLHGELIEQAIRLLGNPPGRSDRDVDRRRAISSAYYALFHAICGDAARLVAPDVSDQIRHRIQRWFDHAQVKQLCGRLTKPQLDRPLSDLIGTACSQDLRFVASNFILLQDERHLADYDAGYVTSWDEARLLVELGVRAIGAWSRLQGTAEANIFVLSLLVWKNWEKER